MAKKRSPLVLITGASQGIGAALSRRFAANGARLALVARNATGLERTAAACRKGGADAAAFVCDVTNAGQVAETAEQVRRTLGVPDCLINNAGAFVSRPFVGTSVADFDRMIAVNLRSAFLVTREFVPAMARRRRGDLFFLSSIAALTPYAGGAAYSAAKCGLAGLARVLRSELKASGVRVCCVFLGATYSPSWKGSGVARTRLMSPDEVAQAFVDIWKLGSRNVVEEIVLRPQLGDL
jgi:NAD(P)-dependent dehydrogenase (short-subunit alcohol dehydrogenase family)